ncbi:MAG: hypothetical protein SVW02_03630 [Candidatus Nanohaloarchaea archaeon]|nr:hypothetical protein [Candidatus Nanohaloarchaea archaeon]
MTVSYDEDTTPVYEGEHPSGGRIGITGVKQTEVNGRAFIRGRVAHPYESGYDSGDEVRIAIEHFMEEFQER